MIIDSFEDFPFLSNFHQCKILYREIVYDSVENAYQAQKLVNPEYRKLLANISAVEAKHFEKNNKHKYKFKTRKEFALEKLEIMKELVYIKFATNKELRELLLATGDAYIIEGNCWHDNFYGRCSCDKCKREIKFNWLGRILMEVREILRREVS